MLARTHAPTLRSMPRAEWIHAALRVVLPWAFVTLALIAHG